MFKTLPKLIHLFAARSAKRMPKTGKICTNALLFGDIVLYLSSITQAVAYRRKYL